MRKIHHFTQQKRGLMVKLCIASLLFTALLLQTTSAYSQAGLITNVTTTTGHSYIVSTLVAGTTVYSDRTYQVTTVPAFLNNAPFIKPPNDDKANTSASPLSFNLTQNATVYVAYDPRATVLPAWLSGWQKLVSEVGFNDPDISGLTLYSKTFTAGKITLGGNLASPAAGAKNMYLVIASVPTTQYTLAITTNGNGSVAKSPNQATYTGGTSVTLTATPGAGQQFTGWTGDATGAANPLVITINSNTSITASFAPASSLITNITATTGHPYTLGTLVAGTTVYTDRAYLATDVPAFLNNAPFIKTANDDKTSSAASILSFDLTQSATVYVAYDPRETALPAWLSGWQQLASTVGINDPKISGLLLFSKTFTAGNVTLGGNLASPAAGAQNNYFVIASSQTASYNLSVTLSGNGTVTKSPNQASYSAGTSVILTAAPGAGRQFAGWSGDASGGTNPLTVTMDANKSITATFTTSGTGPSIATEPLSIYDNDVSGGAAGITRTVTVKNTGSSILSVSSIKTAGTNANQFVLSGLPAFPANIGVGGSVSFSIAFNPTSTGLKTASININSNDPASAVTSIPLRGLGTVGLGGSNEPSLQSLLNLLEIQANVGDNDIATTVINSNTTIQKAPLLGDEVSIQQFQKVGPGNVTITPLGVFGPTATNPIIGLGWYKSGDASSKSELFTVSNSPASNGQTVNVNLTGALSFDPASGAFGFYCRWPFFSDRLMYSEDNLNTFAGAVPHHIRVFPYKKNGVIIPNSYLVTFEDNTSSLDYNDVMFLVSNVKKFSAKTTASNSLLFVRNMDGFPSNDHVSFARIQIPWTRDTLEPKIYNANHDSLKIRLYNKGISPLIISDLKISNEASWKIDKLKGIIYSPLTQLPLTINSGDSADMMVKFIATGSQSTRVKILHETLTITSNDDIYPDKQIFLDGLWQYRGEGQHEPNLQEMFTIFGFKTKTGFISKDPDKGDSTKIKGDEIKPDYFLRADSSLPVTVRQLTAYHGCCRQTEHFKWFDKGTKVYNDLFLQIGLDAQSILPRRSLNGTPAAGIFNPTKPFGIIIGSSNSSDPNLNPEKKLGVRVYKAIDEAGNVIPNTYLLGSDYLGTPVTNFDYNDNTYYISNVKPYLGTVYNSPLNVTPSDLDFEEKVLQTTNSLLLNISNGGKTYPNGSQDPSIVISSVVISGENQSEFSADMPLSTTLTPQQATTINVKFKPTSQGLKIADLLIYYNSSKSPKRVPLYGIAKVAGVTVTTNYRINSGASSAVTINGKTWAADNQYAHDNLEPYKNPKVKQIACTDNDVLYLDEQSSNGEKKPFRYQFPVSNGNYHVRLHFAEVFWGSPGNGLNGGAGSRVFSVKIENQYRLVNYDVIQDVGAATAVIKNFPVTVTDGNLNIDFSAVVNRPLVMAIEVYRFSSSLPRPGEVPTIQNRLAVVPANQLNESVYNFGTPRVYPNPLRNKNFNIQFPPKYRGVYTLQLADILGRKYELGRTKLNGAGSNMKVDISRLALKPGVYFLKIRSDANKTDVLKLLIQ